jgi:hypothetical protein
MSIYATWLAIDADDDNMAPIRYQGSHVLPTDDDDREGMVLLCAIPAFIPHNLAGEDYPDELDEVLPWLRLTVNQEAVVLDRDQVRQMHAMLADWLYGETDDQQETPR